MTYDNQSKLLLRQIGSRDSDKCKFTIQNTYAVQILYNGKQDSKVMYIIL